MPQTVAQKRWYKDNQERVAFLRKRYAKENKERIKVMHDRYAVSVKGKFVRAKRSAIYKGYTWDLTIEQYACLIQSNICIYCSDSLPTRGSGLDRKNSELGYSVDNCVACCFRCNAMKSNFWSYEEFKVGFNGFMEAVKRNLNGTANS